MEINNKTACDNNKLQDTRKRANLSQAALAKAAGVSIRLLQSYERGARDINGARLETLLKICNTLKCNLEDILTDQNTLELLKVYNLQFKE